MAAGSGRDLRIKYDSGGGATAIAGARTDNLTINRGGIDITDKDDSGVRTFLDGELGTFSVSASVQGVLKDATLVTLAAGQTSVDEAFEIVVIGLGTFAGNFMISSLEVAGEEGENPTTFTANLESSGAVTFTAS